MPNKEPSSDIDITAAKKLKDWFISHSDNDTSMNHNLAPGEKLITEGSEKHQRKED